MVPHGSLRRTHVKYLQNYTLWLKIHCVMYKTIGRNFRKAILKKIKIY